MNNMKKKVTVWVYSSHSGEILKVPAEIFDAQYGVPTAMSLEYEGPFKSPTEAKKDALSRFNFDKQVAEKKILRTKASYHLRVKESFGKGKK
jgi:hypothetical protein